MDLGKLSQLADVALEPRFQEALGYWIDDQLKAHGKGAEHQPMNYRVRTFDLGVARDLASNATYPDGPRIELRARGFFVVNPSATELVATLRAGLPTADPLPIGLSGNWGFAFDEPVESWWIENTEQTGETITVIFYD